MAAGAGAAAFWAAHAVEAARWHDWFAGVYDPWFLNSGRAIAFTLACLFVVSAVVTQFDRSASAARGLATAAGAVAAMTATLLLKATGAGTIAPVVLIVGAALLLVSSMAGAWAVALVGQSAAARR